MAYTKIKSVTTIHYDVELGSTHIWISDDVAILVASDGFTTVHDDTKPVGERVVMQGHIRKGFNFSTAVKFAHELAKTHIALGLGSTNASNTN